MTALLRLEAVGHRFGGLVAVDNVNLTIEAGARHGIVGANGAGKTTLINLVAGNLRPSSGRILLSGRDITGLGPAARARRGLGRTFQHPALFGSLTARANIALGLARQRPRTRRSWWPPAARRLAALSMLDEFGLAGCADMPAAHLPYGQQRLLELAVTLAAGPRLLLLDEPSAGLDQTQIGRLLDLIAGLAEQLTILIVDHHPDVMRTVADTVTTLHQGRSQAGAAPPRVEARAADRSGIRRPGSDGGRRPNAEQPRAAGLRVRNLTVGYHRRPVLSDVSFDLDAGETVAVVGRAGSGKTTLLDALIGLAPSDGARIEFNGQRLAGAGPRHFAQAGVSLVPQRRRLFALTVAEHLSCAAAVAHTPVSERLWTPQTALGLFPALARRRYHRATQLSGGEQQMLALARALVTNPGLLLLDEPTDGLAAPVREQVWFAVRHLTAHGACVLLATTNQQHATQVANRVLALDAGRASAT